MAITNEELKTAIGTEYRSLKAIGEDLGVTRERVRQLLKNRGIRKPARIYISPVCTVCNLPNYRYRYASVSTGGEQQMPKFRRHQECQRLSLTCPDPCGKTFNVSRSDGRLHRKRTLAADVWFCSKSCWTKWRWRMHHNEYDGPLKPVSEYKSTIPLKIDIGMLCTHCGTDVRWDADRISSDGEAKLTLTPGREDVTFDVAVDGWMCGTCQEVDCDACGKRSKDYDIVDSGDGTGMFACATCMGREEEN
jgi:hypothetical protein